jgi:hypothetical protein
MLYPADPTRRFPYGHAVSATGPVTCVACGCRLQLVGPEGAAAWFHFSPLGGRDARGCRVPCVDAAHDANGLPLSVRTAA